MISRSCSLAVVAVLALAGQFAVANDVNEVAIYKQTVPAGSDVLVTLPVNTAVEAVFTVDSVSGDEVSLNESLASGAYGPTFFVRVIDGAGAGLWSTITSTPSNDTLKLANAEVAAKLANGNTIRVYAHWTIGTVFSSDTLGLTHIIGTQVLFFDNAATGQNKPIVDTNTYSSRGGWGANASKIIAPETMFVVRNPSAGELTFIAKGFTPDHAVAYLIPANVDRDFLTGTGYPVDVTVEESGFGGVVGRQIIQFDNDATGQNKPIVNTETYSSRGGWGAGGATILEPGDGYGFRQGAAQAGGMATVKKPY